MLLRLHHELQLLSIPSFRLEILALRQACIRAKGDSSLQLLACTAVVLVGVESVLLIEVRVESDHAVDAVGELGVVLRGTGIGGEREVTFNHDR